MSAKEEFIQIYRDSIRREGADALLDYLEQSTSTGAWRPTWSGSG